MSESLVLTSAVAVPSIASYRVARIILRRLPKPMIVVDVVSNNGDSLTQVYEGVVAQTLLNQLNTMNFTSNSLEKRVLERLNTDGFLIGSVSGSPGD